MKRYPEFEIDAISVRDNTWKSLDFSKYDAIFNTAALAHNNARKGTEKEFIELNAVLPEMIARKAKEEGVPLFIHMSSMIVYGSLLPLGNNKKYTINTKPKPNNIYGRSKLMGEQAILKLQSERFKVACIRSPLVYGENAVDNFKKLVGYACVLPVFPDIKNERSMIYSDNLCELIRLIIINNACGIFYPQQERYICTSQMVKDIADASGHKMVITRCFNPVLKAISKKIKIVDKVFGSEAYKMNMSDAFDGKYRVVDYQESILRIAKAKKK